PRVRVGSSVIIPMLPAQPIERGPCSRRSMTTIVKDSFAERVNAADWDALTDEVTAYGCALLPQLLSPPEAAAVAALYDQPEHFRATINMQRYQFGQGEYRYFKAPFPAPVEQLRQ